MFILATVAFVLGIHALSRRWRAPLSDTQSETLAGAALFCISALCGLILALVFAPAVLNLGLLTLHAGFAGHVMRLIQTVSNPYDDAARLPPAAFERMIERRIGGQGRDHRG